MGVEPSVPGEIPDQESGGAPPENPAYKSLLKDREYGRLAYLLEDSALAAKSERPPIANSLILAARQLCQACIDCQEQEESLEQLHETTIAHECDLRQTLQVILILLDRAAEGQLVGLSAPELGIETAGPGETTVQSGFWQRIQELLRWAPSTAMHQTSDEPAVASPKGPTEPDADDAISPTRSPDLEADDRQSIKPDEIPSGSEADSITGAAAGDRRPSLVVYCLGAFRAYVNEQLIDDWKGIKSKSVFKYMVTHRERPIPLEILMDLFWHDDEPEQARRNLYQTIYLLRQALQTAEPGITYILSDDGCYGLNPALEIWLDSEAFLAHYLAGQKFDGERRWPEDVHQYELAENLYGGGFLEEDIYEDWTSTQRENLRMAYLDVLSRLSQHHFEQKNWALSVAYCHKILQIDNCHEQTHRRLMRVYIFQRQRHLALRQFHHCMEALQQELNVAPATETTDLYCQIINNALHFSDT